MLADLQNTVDEFLPQKINSSDLLSEMESLALDMSPKAPTRNRKQPRTPLKTQSDLFSKETKKAAKQCCVCDGHILTGGATLNGKHYHNEHFICLICHRSIKDVAAFEKNGGIYCEKDFHKKFSPECAVCKEPIKDGGLEACGNNFHLEHFYCGQCGKVLDPEECNNN
jgi:Fe2+ or Zn2+ uptake regulation protein